jgi:hypothetical protein
MKPGKNNGHCPASGNNDGQEKERLLGERRKIVARLHELDERQMASYIRAPDLHALQGLAGLG